VILVKVVSYYNSKIILFDLKWIVRKS
jgi:hypothetical protein